MYMYIYVHIYSYTDTWTYIHANRFVRRIAALLAEGWFVEGGGGRGGGADGKHSAPGEAAVGLSLPGDGSAAALPAKTKTSEGCGNDGEGWVVVDIGGGREELAFTIYSNTLAHTHSHAFTHSLTHTHTHDIHTSYQWARRAGHEYTHVHTHVRTHVRTRTHAHTYT